MYPLIDSIVSIGYLFLIYLCLFDIYLLLRGYGSTTLNILTSVRIRIIMKSTY